MGRQVPAHAHWDRAGSFFPKRASRADLPSSALPRSRGAGPGRYTCTRIAVLDPLRSLRRGNGSGVRLSCRPVASGCGGVGHPQNVLYEWCVCVCAQSHLLKRVYQCIHTFQKRCIETPTIALGAHRKRPPARARTQRTTATPGSSQGPAGTRSAGSGAATSRRGVDLWAKRTEAEILST